MKNGNARGARLELSKYEIFFLGPQIYTWLQTLKVWNLTISMLGSEETYNLSAKAAESKGLLKFIRWLLVRHGDDLINLGDDICKASHLSAATENALAMDDVLNSDSRTLSRNECQNLLNRYIRFLLHYLRAGGVLKPKCHLLFHMVQRALFKGNPRLYSTYRDESLNGVFAKIARSAHRVHQKNFEAYISN